MPKTKQNQVTIAEVYNECFKECSNGSFPDSYLVVESKIMIFKDGSSLIELEDFDSEKKVLFLDSNQTQDLQTILQELTKAPVVT